MRTWMWVACGISVCGYALAYWHAGRRRERIDELWEDYQAEAREILRRCGLVGP